mgnify:CR=1 FL=1
MMKSVLIYGVLFWVLGCYKAAGQEAIGLYDLHYTLETDLSTPCLLYTSPSPRDA